MEWTKGVKSGDFGRGVLVWGKLDVAFEMRLAFLFVSERRRFLLPFSLPCVFSLVGKGNASRTCTRQSAE